MIPGLPDATVFGDVSWPPPPRSPLPPFPPGQYDRGPIHWPLGAPDFLRYRGNFCGVRVPGIPILPGMAGYTVPEWRENKVGGKNPPIMALDIPRYWHVSRDLVVENLAAHSTVRGYTHLQCSVGHAIEQGLSLDDYVEYSALVRSMNLFPDQWFLGGGPWSARDMGSDYWAPIIDPWIDALLSNGVITTACVGWQLDTFNTVSPRSWCKFPNPFLSTLQWLAGRLGPHQIPIGTHWINEAGICFGDAGTDPYPDRFAYWRAMRGLISWFHHQGDVNMPIPEYQAKLVDTLNPFGDGRMGTSGLFGDRPYGLNVFECSAQEQFDLRMSEDEGDLRGLLLCCTVAATMPVGYGNGARQPDGSVL